MGVPLLLGADTEPNAALLFGAELNITDLLTGYEGGCSLIVGDFKEGTVRNGVGYLGADSLYAFLGFERNFAANVTNTNFDLHDDPSSRQRCFLLDLVYRACQTDAVRMRA